LLPCSCIYVKNVPSVYSICLSDEVTWHVLCFLEQIPWHWTMMGSWCPCWLRLERSWVLPQRKPPPLLSSTWELSWLTCYTVPVVWNKGLCFAGPELVCCQSVEYYHDCLVPLLNRSDISRVACLR
jgi:hypothetical protein